MSRREICEMKSGEYTISMDPERIDINVVYEYLYNDAYWLKGIPRDVVERSVRNSLCSNFALTQ